MTSHIYSLIPRVLIVLAFISLKLLLNDNLGDENEIDVLPLARQFADPNWIPGDWYLNQPSGYRLLFNFLFGKLIVVWGFLATSITGRLACYGLVALGLVLIGKRLGLSLPLLLLAIGLFLHTDQGVAATEWMLGGLEAKSFAYGLVLLALALMLTSRYYWMALMLGLATSFHVLIGAWTFLVVLGWLVLRGRNQLTSVWHLGLLLGLYLLTSVLAIKPVIEQLFTTLPQSTVTPSYIYVFLRLPHHLNPLSWSSEKWIKLALYLLVLAFCIILLRRSPSNNQSQQYIAQTKLSEFTLLSLIPFLIGLAITPFDSQGRLLQYYPFRLGDIILPLNTYLLLACTLQQIFAARAKQLLAIVCIVLLSGACSIQFASFYQQYLALYQFPDVKSEFKAVCDWVRTSTPANATIVSPPVEFVNFTWLAERPTIAKFKLLPQTKTGILDWYERLSDLSGGSVAWSTAVRYRNNTKEIKQKLTDGYNQLTTAQVDALMAKYKATYFMSRVEHQLNLPRAYYNSRYVIYGRNTAA